VANHGTAVVEVWQLRVWLDENVNGLFDSSELVVLLPGLPVAPGCSVWRVCGFDCPAAATELWAGIECTQDRDSENNRARVAVSPGVGRLLCLGLSRFSPNGDGFEDSVPVSYELPEADGELAVAVVDLSGRVRRRLWAGRVCRCGGRLWWNGRDDEGSAVAGGIYALRLDLRTAVRSYVDKRPVVVVR
jgi:hypothetical protein